MFNDESQLTVLKCRANPPSDMSHETFMSLMAQYIHTALHEFEERQRLEELLGIKGEPNEIDEKLRAICLKEVQELSKKELRKLRKMDRERRREEEHAEFIRLTKLSRPTSYII